MAMSDNVIIRFKDVSFDYGPKKPILDEVSFSIRRGSKVTLMGQNGAGKSTIFNLLIGKTHPEYGSIVVDPNISVGIARQVIDRDQLDFRVREFFEKCFDEKIYDIDPRIDEVLEIVNLVADKDKLVKSFSGGQQARLLLASALIAKPDLLLLDEPTNNLDKAGIEHLTKFLIDYDKTVVVISHDADFLNAFTHGVLYLDIYKRKVENYSGNYFKVVSEIEAQVRKEQSANARLLKEISENKQKANFFAKKGGGMRMVAKKMREKAEADEEAMVDIRRDDKTIRAFTIPEQEELSGELISIEQFSVIKNHKPKIVKKKISLRKNEHLQLIGPNGIGKSTLLETLATFKTEGVTIAESVTIGYYRQDFSTLNFDDKVYKSLMEVMKPIDEHQLRSVAAGFLIDGELINTRIGDLSEGQKGLVAMARLVLQKPGLLILDEPTNHINFRHLPIIASALNQYKGAMILVSHVPEFVSKIRIDQVLDLEK